MSMIGNHQPGGRAPGTDNTPGGGRAAGFLRRSIGYLIAPACLVWVFHDVKGGELIRDMAGTVWPLVAIAVVFDALGYLMQGLRWALLLRSVGRLSVARATQAVYIGLFTSELLPLRLGELARAVLVARWLSAEIAAVVSSIAVERFFDGIWLALAFGVVAVFVPLPVDLLHAEEILGVAVILLTAFFVRLVFRKAGGNGMAEGKAEDSSQWGPLRTASSFLERIVSGLQKIGTSRSFFLSLCVSSLIVLFQVISYWLVMRAYRIDVSIWVGAAVLLIVRLGTAVPNAPSNVGTYQFFTVVGLALFGVDKTTATGFSVVVFFVLTVPLWAIGVAALRRTGMTWAGVRNEISRVRGRP